MYFFYIILFQPNKELLYKHYEDLKSRPFFPGLIKYMVSGPVVAMVRCRDSFHITTSYANISRYSLVYITIPLCYCPKKLFTARLCQRHI